MIRVLDGMVLLKEVDDIDGIEWSSDRLKKQYPDKVFVIRHNSYIYRDVLDESVIEKTTNLDDYVPVGELADALSVRKEIFLNRIEFMKNIGEEWFEYITIKGMHFIKLEQDVKELMLKYQPFLANMQDANNLVHCKLIADLKVGFY
jgi:hypothetical protein